MWRRLGGAALGAVAAVVGQDLHDDEPACHGYDEQFGPCEDQPDCGKCIPMDCRFSTWGDWYPGGGCSGLLFRERDVEAASNECGRPCGGAKIQSKRGILPGCLQQVEDCEFGDWSDWTHCHDEQDQVTRVREIADDGSQLGHGCEGATKETKPCKDAAQAPCRFSAWQLWTPCSSTCGEGRRTRMRHVARKAVKGGTPCNDALLEVSKCQDKTCASVDCKVVPWSEWTSCNEGLQRFRTRMIVQAPSGDGRPCPKELMETKGCAAETPAECELSSWTEWTECSRTCGGGQSYRERRLKRPNDRGGSCEGHSLKETIPCETSACFLEVRDDDCKFSEWDQWSECSVDCGKGQESRKRVVKAQSKNHGHGCSGPLQELRGCERHDCFNADCRWGEWFSWSACSVSCGGGTKRRSRMVEVAPTTGGELCEPLSKAEVHTCHTEECPQGDCVDGRWGSWMEWTECSATCSSGFRSRRRDIEVQPNSCGQPALGLREEFQVCQSPEPCVKDQDCEMSPWGEWSQCSCTCFGIRERNRFITAFASGNGHRCLNTATKVIEPCNPSAGANIPRGCGPDARVDCVLNDWEEWSGCSASCGGGQRKRSRSIHIPPRFGGRPCHGTLAYTAPCNVNSCQEVQEVTCKDCKWGAWTEWGECSGCGGQKFRHRSIEQMANDCGTPCDLRSAKETTSCDKEGCGTKYFCTWNEWSEATACASCGTSAVMRNRAMRLSAANASDYLFHSGEKDVHGCAGTQLNVSLCPYRPSCEKTCEPRDCTFSEWGEWAEPTWVGLCERHRAIDAINNKCGKPCRGAILETKQCAVPKVEKQDGVLSAWSDWSYCITNDFGQRLRERHVVRNPQGGGAPCEGNLKETLPCSQAKPKDCELHSWGEWGACTQTCGNFSLQERKRDVMSPATGGGVQCGGDMQQLRQCAEPLEPCPDVPKDCKLTEWTEWTVCDSDNQRYRHRKVERWPLEGGSYCEGAMRETETCSLEVVNCLMSPWTPWSICDKTCGGGQSERQRQIQRFPEHGGEVCPDALIQTYGCNVQTCELKPENCIIGTWGEWGACSSSCGVGQQSRKREIDVEAGHHGVGCDHALAQTRACKQDACLVQDCEWGDWSRWSACTCTCGGGTRARGREIVKEPRGGGKRCVEGDKEQVEPCNTQRCVVHKVCIDGTWGPWTEWSLCSATCARGVALRRRAVATMANECGQEPLGKDVESRYCKEGVPCEPNIDCKLSNWEPWSDCSQSCAGVKRRSRHVEIYGRGDGRYCEGALKETFPCNPGPVGMVPHGCAGARDMDCQLSKWTRWTDCTAECGGGQSHRVREIVQHAAAGGRGCVGGLYDVMQCNMEPCGGRRVPVDCLFGDWEEWGPCGKCSGERKRLRHIIRAAENGGRNCDFMDTEQLGTCPMRCDSEQRLFCTWQPWEQWSKCSKDCGPGGRRTRRRHLHLSTDESAMLLPAEELIDTFEMLSKKTKELEEIRLRELVTAFVAGCASLVVVSMALRGAFAARERWKERRSSYRALLAHSALAPAASSQEVELPLVERPGAAGP